MLNSQLCCEARQGNRCTVPDPRAECCCYFSCDDLVIIIGGLGTSSAPGLKGTPCAFDCVNLALAACALPGQS